MGAVTAASPNSPDSTTPHPTVNFAKARFAQFQLETWLTSDEAQHLPEHLVEEEAERQGREIIRLMLQAHFHERGTGDLGPALRVYPAPPDAADTDPPPAVVHTHKRLHERTLTTTVGPIVLERTAYGCPGQASIHPLDAEAALPDRSFSYPLQERLVRGAIQGPFDEAVANVQLATDVVVCKRSCEQLVQQAAVDVQAFYHQQTPPATATGPIVATGVDCKGVPMLKPEQTLRTVRRGKGEKKNKKRMATVATVRTHQPRVRTPEEVVESLFADKPKAPQPRRPRSAAAAAVEHKRVWASLTGSKDEVIAEVAREAKRCDPDGSKHHVALCDGERALQKRLGPALTAAVGSVVVILDLMHVLEKLWKAAYCFHAEGSDEATAWVRKYALLILQGGVSQVVKGIRQSASKRGLRGTRRQTINQVTAYLYRNRKRMCYDDYLRAGLPIASGSVEGACRHLIKDRLERAGMRWTLAGAEALICLRAAYVSGDFEEYWDYHLEREQQRLHPQGQWEVVEE